MGGHQCDPGGTPLAIWCFVQSVRKGCRVCFVNKEVSSFLLVESNFAARWRVIIVCFIDDFRTMLNGIQVANILSRVTSVLK